LYESVHLEALLLLLGHGLQWVWKTKFDVQRETKPTPKENGTNAAADS